MATITINSIAGDSTINVTEASTGFRISGTTTGIENGRTVTVHIHDLNGDVVARFGAVVANGTWSANLSGAQASALPGNTHLVTAEVTSLFGDLAQALSPLSVDKIAPVVASFTRADAATTNAGHVHYTLTFSEPVTAPLLGDFAIDPSSTVSGAGMFSVTPVFGSNGTQYTVDVFTGTGDGTLTLDLLGHGIEDLAGNGFGGGAFHILYASVTDTRDYSVAIGDLNQDGKPDLVVGNAGFTDGNVLAPPGNTLTVLLGRGDGTFQTGETDTTGLGPRSVAIADVNQDGRLDIVTANFGSASAPGNTASVLLGNGDGTFQAQHTFATGVFPSSVAVADVNQDGRPDLVVASQFDKTVSVLLGNGDGTFQGQQAYAVGAFPFSVAVGDVNGDGRPDLITANRDDSDVSVLIGNGDGTFQTRHDYSVGDGPVSVAVGDVNHDGKLDIVTRNEAFLDVSILLGNGDGSFQNQHSYTTNPQQATLPFFGGTVVTIGDVNGDGNPDIVTADGQDGTVSILFGSGDGSFHDPRNYEIAPLFGNRVVMAVAIGDVTGDGRLDVIAPGLFSPLVGAMVNDVTAQAGPSYTLGTSAAPTALASSATIAEDMAKTFAAGDFLFSDPEDTPPNALKAVIVASLPTHGTLAFGGAAVTATDVIAADQIGSLVYTPDGNFDGADSFTFEVQDDGGTERGGQDTSASAATMSITVSAVNDAPVATQGSAPLADINEDSHPAGQSVTALVGGVFSDAADDQVPNGGSSTANSLAGVAVTANAEAGNGHWQYSTDAGAHWTDIGTAVSDANALLLDSKALVRFDPAPDQNGAAPLLSVRLIDDSQGGVTSGATADLSGPDAVGGTTAYSAGTIALAQNIVAVNDPPVNTVPVGQTVTEDTDLAITGLAVADPDIEFGNIRVTLHVDNGTLQVRDDVPGGLDGADITYSPDHKTVTLECDPAFVNATLAAANGVVYHPDLNYNGPDQLVVTTNDLGSSGVDPSTLALPDTGDTTSEQAVSTVDITVVAQDDAPNDIQAASPLQVNEFSANTAVASLVAQDVDNNSGFTYTLLDNAGGRFSMTPDGELSVLNGLLLDFEQNPQHKIVVRVTDPNGLTFDKDMFVDVNDINPENVLGDNNDNFFVGGADSDTLNGAGANDRLQGRGGNNTLIGGPGSDTTDYTTAPGGVYMDFATGNTYINGWGGADTISGIEQFFGSTHDDVVRSGPGNHFIDGGAGLDAVDYSAAPNGVSASLATGTAINGFGGVDTLANIESALGSSHNDTLTGNALNNVLFGDGGVDTMTGGAGDDVYGVDTIGDQVIENAGEGMDTVYATINYALAPNVENLFLTGSAVAGVGNGLSNQIEGNALDNAIDGAGGADVMIGGGGNDTYFVDNPLDQVVENVGGGNDAVLSSVSYTLAPNVENLFLTGTAMINGTGNDQDNVIVGNSESNFIDGGAGADIMIGGFGHEIYVVDNAGDKVIELPGQGFDTVNASVSFLIEDNIENLNLTGSAVNGVGNSGANNITGNGLDNVIDGRGGADTMSGGAGNDTYFVDNAGDNVVEAAGQGTDTVNASVSTGLSANVENLNLTGTANLNAVGNGLANTVNGNSGNNGIDGGAGADILAGGGGNDTFFFGVGQTDGDTITDFNGNGPLAGDVLVFSGFGPGATFTNVDATHWAVNYNAGANHEVITFSNAALIHPSDFLFT